MEKPHLQGYELQGEIGSGASGTVFAATKSDGTRCAVKVFDSMSSNTGLLVDRINRVSYGRAMKVTVPILAEALDARPGCVIMPLLVEERSGVLVPRTLQGVADYFQGGQKSREFLDQLAARLGVLHSAHVAHGNLKPGNLFFDAYGGPLLADYATGLMPGIHRPLYSDAQLYAPPEQLRQPETYLSEAGYRWDVYAFGVLAFRLLNNGAFPRADSLFQTISPALKSQARAEFEVDLASLIAHLEQGEETVWQSEAQDIREQKQRAILQECLALDPKARPFDMREVSRRLGEIDAEIAAGEHLVALTKERDLAKKKRAAAHRRFKGATFVALGLGAGWGITQFLRQRENDTAAQVLADYKTNTNATIAGLEGERDSAASAREVAYTARDQALTQLASEQAAARAELSSAQLTNEQLFDWVLEEGVPGLPTLQGRDTRLGWLLEKIDEQLEGLEQRPELAAQAAVLKLRRAEIVLAQGDAEAGVRHLEIALADEHLPPKLTLRAELRRLLLLSLTMPTQLTEDFKVRQKTIVELLPGSGRDQQQTKAALSLVEARVLVASGQREQAFSSYLRTLDEFKKLAERFPANQTIALVVGKTHLSAAKAARGAGAIDDAAELRAEAAKAFADLAEQQDNPAPEILYQIASAKAAQAISAWQKGDTFKAEKLAREGVTQLTALAAKMPGDFRVVVDLASQQGIIATALRDEGRRTDARAILEGSIKQLRGGLEKELENWNARYLLASLKWQLSGVLRQQGQRESELTYGTEAKEELTAILAAEVMSPEPSEVRRSLAYLCGDLGHAAELQGKREIAIVNLKECQKHWQILVRDKGDQLEFREGYHWADARLKEMKAP